MNRFSAALAATVLVGSAAIATLSGCGSADPVGSTAVVDLSLSDSKAAAQLALNELIGQVDPALLAEGGTQRDASTGCLSKDQDADGLVRRWTTIADISLKDPSQADAALAAVVDVYLAEGWSKLKVSASEGGEDAVLLSVSSSHAQIILDPSSSGLHLVSRGPCVTTEGKDSPDVKTLEGRS